MAGSDLKRSHSVSVIVGLTMAFSVVVLAVLCEIIHRGVFEYGPFPISQTDESYTYIRCALLIVVFVLLLIIHPLRSFVRSNAKADNPQAKLFVGQMVAYSLCETVGVYGLVLYLIAGNIWDVYVFCGFSLISLALFFPRYDQWREWAASQWNL